MTTFSDMVTLLLTFFILLYSISNVDAQKFQNISSSLQAVLTGGGSPAILDGQPSPSEFPVNDPAKLVEELLDNTRVKESTLRMYEQVKGYIEEKGLEAEVSVSLNRSGVFVDIKEVILFEPGEASLKAGGKEILDNLEGLFLQFENEIVVEGHTDNVPMRSQTYPTNWELSAGRALAVVRYLSEVKHVPEKRLAAIGYGEYRPIISNETPANRALNRRVNLLIIIEEGESL
jgi:chemotaxis protein MotB